MTRAEKSRRGNRAYWDRMTPEQRKKEMAKRFKKWDPKARAKWQGGGKKTKSAKARAKMNRIYQARHNAKKNGQTPPPLPSELAA